LAGLPAVPIFRGLLRSARSGSCLAGLPAAALLWRPDESAHPGIWPGIREGVSRTILIRPSRDFF